MDARRSIYTDWPPDHCCERCEQVQEAGYVGPVDGDWVHFPSPTLRFVCETCVRAQLGLGPEDLTGHCCSAACTDRLHVELVDGGVAGHLLGRPPAADDPLTAGLQRRGWRVADVTRPPSSWAAAPEAVAVWIEPVKPLPWALAPRGSSYL